MRKRKCNLFHFDEDIAVSGKSRVVSDDAKRVAYYGIDCINTVFALNSSRTRDFCRLFVKLDLLPHLASAFMNAMYLYHRSYLTNIIHREANKPMNSVSHDDEPKATGEFNFSKIYDKKTDGVAGYSSLFRDNEADKSEEYKHALTIATIFLNFSRSNAQVAEHMTKNDNPYSENLSILDTILLILQSPELKEDKKSAIDTMAFFPTTPRNRRPSTNTITQNDKFCRIATKQGRLINLSNSYLKILILLLRCLKNLSMEATVLSDMEKAGTIAILVPLLNGPIRENCKPFIFPCIFNLCRINKARQEQVAVCGMIPHLQAIIMGESHVRQIALPIFCSMAHASPRSRQELWKYNGAATFINLLKDKFWQTFAFNALATW